MGSCDLLSAGGNVDDRRIGIGATVYYPVAVEGGLAKTIVSMGDAHSAQGDSEFDGKPTWCLSCGGPWAWDAS